MAEPTITIETIEHLTALINDGESDIDDLIDVVLQDKHWTNASREQATTFISRTLEGLNDG